MITEEKKNALAVASGLAEERRVEMIRTGVKVKYSLEDELALLRKELKWIGNILSEICKSSTLSPEFLMYDAFVESVKANSYPDKSKGKGEHHGEIVD